MAYRFTLIRTSLFFICLAITALPHSVLAVSGAETPHNLVGSLRQGMYIVGERTGKRRDFIREEKKAARAMGKLVKALSRRQPAANEVDYLLEGMTAGGSTPLMAAAYMGYPQLVEQLLQSQRVRAAINYADKQGNTVWTYTNFAMRQSMWVCNPIVFQAPFKLVPLLVTQPFYNQETENPYRKIRYLLEQAGAKVDHEQAKQAWQAMCEHKTKPNQTKVEESKDLLETLLILGREELDQYYLGIQNTPN